MVPRRHALKIALGAVVLVLLGVIAAELALGPRSAPDAAPKGAAPPLGEAKLLPLLAAAPAEQAYPETGTRPLFVPGRRPAPAGASSGSLPKGQYTLHGVILVDGLEIAMLKDKASGKTVRIEKGKEVNGLRLTAVAPDRVTIAQGDDSEEIALVVQKGLAAVAAAVPAGPFSAPPAASGAASAPTTVAPSAPRPPGSGPMPVQGAVTAPAATAGGVAANPQLSPTEAIQDVLARSRARRAQRLQQSEQQTQSPAQNVQK